MDADAEEDDDGGDASIIWPQCANIAFDAGGRSLNETDGTHTVIIVKCLHTRKEKLNTLSHFVSFIVPFSLILLII